MLDRPRQYIHERPVTYFVVLTPLPCGLLGCNVILGQIDLVRLLLWVLHQYVVDRHACPPEVGAQKTSQSTTADAHAAISPGWDGKSTPDSPRCTFGRSCAGARRQDTHDTAGCTVRLGRARAVRIACVGHRRPDRQHLRPEPVFPTSTCDARPSAPYSG